MIDLTGQTALVTGSSRGIGRACAQRLAEAGADVVVNYLTSQAAAAETAERIARLGRRAYVVKADVSEEEDVLALADFLATRVGRLDVLVSNAAGGGFRPLLETGTPQLLAAMQTNAFALLHLVRSLLPLLERSGRLAKVIALSSHGAERTLPGYGAVGASKAVLESLVRQLAVEVGPRGVNVNILRAGLVATDAVRSLPGIEQRLREQRQRGAVRGRTLTPEDVANGVLFLASPLSDLMQGATLVLDGGVSLPL